jgi:hypothetical protein
VTTAAGLAERTRMPRGVALAGTRGQGRDEVRQAYDDLSAVACALPTAGSGYTLSFTLGLIPSATSRTARPTEGPGTCARAPGHRSVGSDVPKSLGCGCGRDTDAAADSGTTSDTPHCGTPLRCPGTPEAGSRVRRSSLPARLCQYQQDTCCEHQRQSHGLPHGDVLPELFCH